jgi:hypothetical protein
MQDYRLGMVGRGLELCSSGPRPFKPSVLDNVLFYVLSGKTKESDRAWLFT